MNSSVGSGVRPTSGDRLEGVEGLRAIAAGSVLVYHTWIIASPSGAWADAGPLTSLLPDLSFGVVLFFTLSGFLLYRPFVAGLLGHRPRPQFARYLRNRFLRIAPAYIVILLSAALVLRHVLVRDETGELYSGGVGDATELLGMVFLVQHYSPSTVLTGIGPAWSLAAEVVFYALLPLLVLAGAALARGDASRTRRRWAALAPPMAVLALGLAGKAVAAYAVPPVSPYAGWNADWHSVIERSFLCHADLFAFGMALAVLKVETEHGGVRLHRLTRPALAVLVVAGYVVTAQATGVEHHLTYSPWNTVMAVVFAGALALVVLPTGSGRRSVVTRVLETRVLVAVGVVSYSVFLWHEPLIRSLTDAGVTFDGTKGFAANVLLVSAVTLLLAALTYRYVERPALLRKQRVRDPAEVPREQLQAAP